MLKYWIKIKMVIGCGKCWQMWFFPIRDDSCKLVIRTSTLRLVNETDEETEFQIPMEKKNKIKLTLREATKMIINILKHKF